MNNTNRRRRTCDFVQTRLPSNDPVTVLDVPMISPRFDSAKKSLSIANFASHYFIV
jgi:hypothetical protein